MISINDLDMVQCNKYLHYDICNAYESLLTYTRFSYICLLLHRAYRRQQCPHTHKWYLQIKISIFTFKSDYSLT